jgi:hypothetical protein
VGERGDGDCRTERLVRAWRRQLSVGALVVAALLAAGLSYWSMRENSQAAASGGTPPLAETSGPPPTITAPAAAPATSQPSLNAPSPAKTAAPAPSQLSQAARPPTTTGAAAPKTATSEPNAVSAATTTTPAGVPAMNLPPPSIAAAAPKSLPVIALPAKTRLSEADRRQAQQKLHRLGYYRGHVDGSFGPFTRTAIQRYQKDMDAEP